MTNNTLRRLLFEEPDQDILFVGEFSDKHKDLYFLADELFYYGFEHCSIEEVRAAIFNLEDQDAKANSYDIAKQLELSIALGKLKDKLVLEAQNKGVNLF